MGDPDFLYAALEMTACAAFIKESRMYFTNANQPHTKSGGSPTTALSCAEEKVSQPTSS
jgi:hypothetical protein